MQQQQGYIGPIFERYKRRAKNQANKTENVLGAESNVEKKSREKVGKKAQYSTLNHKKHEMPVNELRLMYFFSIFVFNCCCGGSHKRRSILHASKNGRHFPHFSHFHFFPIFNFPRFPHFTHYLVQLLFIVWQFVESGKLVTELAVEVVLKVL